MDQTLTPHSLVQDIGDLVTLPDVYLRISRLLDDHDSSISDIAQAVSQDPAFTLRLLRVANSPMYRRRDSVDTVLRAVSVIGTTQIRNLALSMSVAKCFAGLPNDVVSMDNFWRHCLLCASIARHLAQQAGRCSADAVFTGGLLHDVGELVIFNRLPEQAHQVLELMLDSGADLGIEKAEQQVIGFDHCDVGGELARQWGLSSLLEECIAGHHSPAVPRQNMREVALVHLANALAQMAEVDDLGIEDAPTIDPLVWDLTGLRESCIEPAVREAQAGLAEIEKLFIGE
ncbi:MAG TPA: HDOD domain-containing protein [Rhodocyclaceae bacterium]|nr:HDOD domain-containing protein [Rhodocyclaceae bacterium]